MPLIECPNCKKPVSDGADVCIHCGYDLKAMQASTPDTFFALPQDEQDKLKQEFNSGHKELAKKYNNGKLPISFRVVIIISVFMYLFGALAVIMLAIDLINETLINSHIIIILCGFLSTFVSVAMIFIAIRKSKKFNRNSVNYKIHFEKWLMEEKNLNITWDLKEKEYKLYEQMKRSINQ